MFNKFWTNQRFNQRANNRSYLVDYTYLCLHRSAYFSDFICVVVFISVLPQVSIISEYSRIQNYRKIHWGLLL